MLWPANGEMGMLMVEEGKRVEKTFGVQAPLASRRDVQGTTGCVSLGTSLLGGMRRVKLTLCLCIIV